MNAVNKRLLDRWPGRRDQVSLLLAFLGREHDLPPPLFIYGPPATGKTTIIREVLAELGRTYAYVSCAEFSRDKPLLQSVVDQLKGHKRKRSEGYCPSSKAENLADFLVAMQGIAPRSGPTKYIVVDHAHRIADQTIIPALLRLSELAGCKAGVLLISLKAWASCVFSTEADICPLPHQIHFPAYGREHLITILTLRRPENAPKPAFHRFMESIIIPNFARCSNRLDELQELVERLFPLYMHPVESGQAKPEEAAHLLGIFTRKHLEPARQLFMSGARVPSSPDSKPRSAEGLPFELPYTSKFVVLAAFLASRNKPSVDKRLFSHAPVVRRRRNALASDRQAASAQAAQLAGPHPFRLERLLYIYGHLLSSGETPSLLVRLQDIRGDVLMQIASLVSMRLLSQVGGTNLDDMKYACNISEPVALRIARNVELDLSQYLLYV